VSSCHDTRYTTVGSGSPFSSTGPRLSNLICLPTQSSRTATDTRTSRAVAAAQRRAASCDREGHRRSDRVEGGHDAVTRVLDLTAAVGLELLANDLVVNAQQLQVSVVPELGRLLDGSAEVGEQDRSHRRRFVRRACRKRWQCAEERVQRHCRIKLENAAREHAVGLVVHGHDRFLARPLSEAEDRAVARIEPVRVVAHTVAVLYLDVPRVRLGELLRSDLWEVMAVHVHRHVESIRKSRSHGADQPGKRCVRIESFDPFRKFSASRSISPTSSMASGNNPDEYRGVGLFADGSHFTPEAGARLSPWIVDQVTRALAPRSGA
jgi:hypothetical protein